MISPKTNKDVIIYEYTSNQSLGKFRLSPADDYPIVQKITDKNMYQVRNKKIEDENS